MFKILGLVQCNEFLHSIPINAYAAASLHMYDDVFPQGRSVCIDIFQARFAAGDI